MRIFRKVLGISSLLAVLSVLWSSETTTAFARSGSDSPLLYSPGNSRYENLGIEGYRRYGRAALTLSTDPMYDHVGNLLMAEGIEIYQLSEERDQRELEGWNPPFGLTRLDKGEYYGTYLNRLAISNDRYRDWSTTLIFGDRIRTKFTSMTLDLATLNGIRWDLNVRNHSLSFLGSRVDRPVFQDLENLQWRAGAGVFYATYLLGGHWESQIGVLNLGASYVNQYRIDSTVSSRKNSLKGVLPGIIQPIEYMAVKISDGYDRDGGGPRVFDVRIYINGKLRRDLVPTITRHDTEVIDLTFPNGDAWFQRGGRFVRHGVPPYVEFFKGRFPLEEPGPKGYLEANGTEYLIYWFEIPQDGEIRSISFDALVANDYRIDLSEIFVQSPTASKTDPLQRYATTFWERVTYAEGKPGDMSNLNRIRFKYGRKTSGMLAGLHANIDTKGFLFRTEYVRNFNFFQMPTEKKNGKRHDTYTDMFFLNLRKQFGPFSLGTEYFDVPPDYSTTLSVQDPSYVLFTSLPLHPYTGEISAGFPGTYNNTIEFNTVDDNDDKDRFPDWHFIPSQKDRDQVFPGLDSDRDGRPDTNQNMNNIPDYAEAFFLYHVNPDPWDYGDDLNNNGVMDIRENDVKPDYAYDVDLRGYHLFTEVDPAKNSKVTVGYYNTKQISAGGRNIVTYAKADYSRYLPFLAEVNLINFLKRVRDNIPNDTFQWVASSTGVGVEFIEDDLLMKNSLVNTSYLYCRFFKFKNVNIEAQVKYELNMQRLRADRRNYVREWSSVLKSDYTWRHDRLTVRPQLKYMAHKLRDTHERVHGIHENFFYPILRMDYEITRQTMFKAGAQGFPFLKARYRNLTNRSLNFDMENYTAMITNLSSYSGYEFSLNIGYQINREKFTDRTRQFEDTDYSLFFIRLILGLRPIER